MCEDGQWFLHVTKYDPSITPETVCVPDGKYAQVTIPVVTDAMKDLESVSELITIWCVKMVSGSYMSPNMIPVSHQRLFVCQMVSMPKSLFL